MEFVARQRKLREYCSTRRRWAPLLLRAKLTPRASGLLPPLAATSLPRRITKTRLLRYDGGLVEVTTMIRIARPIAAGVLFGLTPAWQAVDNPSYAYSWNEDKVDVASNGSGPVEQVVTGPSA